MKFNGSEVNSEAICRSVLMETKNIYLLAKLSNDAITFVDICAIIGLYENAIERILSTDPNKEENNKW